MLKNIGLVEHSAASPFHERSEQAMQLLQECGITVSRPEDELFNRSELIVAVGGDGTLLRAAASARALEVPVIGFNAGHMGFLTEAEQSDLEKSLRALAAGKFSIEKRDTIELEIRHADGKIECGWALNEAAISRTGLAHPANFSVGVDGQALTAYAADGILISTATGSTAYSFSAGGPIIWPTVSAMLLTPLAAHGLFTTPLVLGPSSQVQVQVAANQRSELQLWFDGLRMFTLGAGAEITAQISNRPVLLARLSDSPFTSRLVAKFHLPTSSWRGGGER